MPHESNHDNNVPTTTSGTPDVSRTVNPSGDDHDNPTLTLETGGDRMDAMLAEAHAAIEREGMRLETFISPRTFATMEEILQLVAGVPKGDSVPLGHIAGDVRGFERRENSMPLKPGENPPPPSIWLRGKFDATIYSTGEVRSASWCILPRVMGEAVADELRDGETSALLDIELGVSATGRAIPYAYTVTSFTANRAQAAITTIRLRHQRRMAAKAQQAALPAPPAAPQAEVKPIRKAK
jgi:hypothetical protein